LVRRKGSGLIAKKIFRRKKVVEGVNGNMHTTTGRFRSICTQPDEDLFLLRQEWERVRVDRWLEGINETLAISKGWLCNRQGFPVKYDFRESRAEAELEISSETRRAWPCKITAKATVSLRGFHWWQAFGGDKLTESV
jgi:hypothetical protein